MRFSLLMADSWRWNSHIFKWKIIGFTRLPGSIFELIAMIQRTTWVHICEDRKKSIPQRVKVNNWLTSCQIHLRKSYVDLLLMRIFWYLFEMLCLSFLETCLSSQDESHKDCPYPQWGYSVQKHNKTWSFYYFRIPDKGYQTSRLKAFSNLMT